MPITKKLIEKMGGTIKFESEKNVGTTFMVQLPFLISADMKQAESQEDDISIEGMRYRKDMIKRILLTKSSKVPTMIS